MAVAGFYRRTLPSPPAIEFASSQGKQLFSEALEGGTMEGFFKLISYYQTQSEPAYCGLATLSVVLNALSIDPGRTWKGPWRWFDDSMLDCCEPLSKIKAEGITFGKVACLAYCNGANVEAFRINETSLDDFRRLVVSSASSEDCHVIASYHRGVLKQTGTGHFSPIGGYHAGRDMVLILDVARFKYPPHWVPLPLLWEAMNTIDEATGRHRGFMIISRLHKASSIFFILNCRQEGWRNVAKYLTEDVPQRLKLHNLKDVENVLSVVFKPAPYDLKEFIKWVAEVQSQEDPHGIISEEEKGRLLIKEKVLKQIRDTELFKFVSRWVASEILLCEGVIVLDCQESLPKTASDVCCQSAELSAGKPSQLDGTICKEKNLALVKSNGEKPSDLCDINQSKCRGMHPSTGDVLTVLLFALPQHTWSGIKEEKLVEQFSSLLSIENLPYLLKEEASMEGSLNIEPLWTANVNHTAITFVNGILPALKSTIQSGKRVSHLRRQLHFLMIDLSEPAPSA